MSTRRPRVVTPFVILLLAALVASFAAVVGPSPAQAVAVIKPSAPRSVAVGPRDSSAIVQWRPPAITGSPRLTEYVVKRATHATGPWIVAARVYWLDRHAVRLTGLRNGRAYYVRVFARSAAGLGVGTRAIRVVPHTTPGRPGSVSTALTRVRGTVDVAWGPAAPHGAPITTYVVQTSRDRVNWSTVGWTGPRARKLAVASLPLGRTYFRVRARNVAGRGPFSPVVSRVLLHGPGAPRDVQAHVNSGLVGLTWVAPASDGGSPITGYRIDRKLTSSSPWREVGLAPATATAYSPSGLTNGVPYLFRVTAITARGPGAESSAVEATPYGVPPKPAIDFAEWLSPSLIQVSPDWTAPGWDGGYGYPHRATVTIQRLDGGTWVDLPAAAEARAHFTGTVGEQYTFRLVVSNPAGASAPSDPVTLTKPGEAARPILVSAQSGLESIHIEWEQGTVAPAEVPATSWLVRYGQDCAYASACGPGAYLPAETLSTDLTGLESGTDYTVWVTACVEEQAYSMGEYVTWHRCSGQSAQAVVTPQ